MVVKHAAADFAEMVNEKMLTEEQAEIELRNILAPFITDSTSEASVDSFIDEFHDLLQ